RPDESRLGALLADCRNAALTYEPVGGSLDGVAPDGLHWHRWSVPLPADAFERAKEGIAAWEVHRGAGLSIVADGTISVGTNVAMSAPLPVGFVDVTCRIVATVDEETKYGFAYGTLPTHPETGEEAFIVVSDVDGVRFDVQAVSAPRHPLARLVPPLA